MQNDFSYSKAYRGDPSIFGKVAVLYGGLSSEREVSLTSGKYVLDALQTAGVNCQGIDVGENLIQQLEQSKPDLVFIILHGASGEDGRVQAVLDLMGIPYTGTDHAGSAIAMDKLISKHVFRSEGLSTSVHQELNEACDWSKVFSELGPVFVKPAGEGSSYGINFAGSADELKTAFFEAKKYDTHVFAEKFLKGPEYSVAILGGQALPPLQIISESEFYDYEAKYLSDNTRYLCPAPVPESDLATMSELALAAFKVLGCRDWGRVDVMADGEGNYFILEANTVPGMTDHSLVPMAAAAVGLSFSDLVLEILTMAWSRAHG